MSHHDEEVTATMRRLGDQVRSVVLTHLEETGFDIDNLDDVEDLAVKTGTVPTALQSYLKATSWDLRGALVVAGGLGFLDCIELSFFGGQA